MKRDHSSVQVIAKWVSLVCGLVFFLFENVDENYQWISWLVPFRIKPDPPFLWRVFAIPTFFVGLLTGIAGLPKWQAVIGLVLIILVFIRIWLFPLN